MSERNFQTDFCLPAIRRLKKKDAQRVAKALDAAIAFGALEVSEGNESLKDLTQVSARYWQLVMELKRL